MSYYFEIAGETVWDPSLRIAKWFLSLTQGAGELIGKSTGLIPAENDTCEIDIRAFRDFVDGLRDCYSSTRHPVQHVLMRGVLLTCLVLLQRSGETIEPKSEREVPILRELEKLSRSM